MKRLAYSNTNDWLGPFYNKAPKQQIVDSYPVVSDAPNETPYRDIQLDEKTQETLSKLGLIAPTVQIEDLVDRRLRRNGLLLEVDKINLAKGSVEAEIEEPLNVQLLTDNSDVVSMNLGVNDEDSPLEVNISIGKRYKDIYHVDPDINSLFWHGLLASAALQHTELNDEFKKSQSRLIRIEQGIQLGGLVLGLSNVIILNHNEIIPVAVASTFAPYISSKLGIRGSLKKFALQKVRNEADEMARSFPIFSIRDISA